MATSADDIALALPYEDYDVALNNSQLMADDINVWTKDWKMKLNTNKSSRVDFTLRPHGSTPTFIEGHPIIIDGSAKYQIFWRSCGSKTYMEDAFAEKTR